MESLMDLISSMSVLPPGEVPDQGAGGTPGLQAQGKQSKAWRLEGEGTTQQRPL